MSDHPADHSNQSPDHNNQPEPPDHNNQPEPPDHNNQPPGAFWKVTDPADPMSAAICDINRNHARLALECVPRDDECVSDVTTRLCVRLGLPEFRVVQLVDVGVTLRRFPSLVELAETGAYSIEVWRIVAHSLVAVSDAHTSAVEADVYTALSPTRPNQAMLGQGTIRQRLKRIVLSHEPLACPIDPTEPPMPPVDGADGNGGADGATDGVIDGATGGAISTEDVAILGAATRLSIDDRSSDYTEFYLTLPKLEALELIQALDSVRNKENCSRVRALLSLVRGSTIAEVNLNLYRRVDAPDSQIWAAGTWLNSLATEEWLERVTHLQAPGKATTAGYTPTPIIRASVEGRDGTCRFPGCDTPAHKCQLDHVKRFERNSSDGGPTDTSNLHCLCTKHHNAKTTGAWDVTIGSDGVETWTSFGDGHTVITTPNGPLGRFTFRHRAVKRTRRVVEHNQRKRGRDQDRDQNRNQNRDQGEEPPF